MRAKLRAFLPALLWMGLIFFMSAQTGEESAEESGKIMALVLRFFGVISGGRFVPDPDTLHLLIRKGAHMTEYAILYLLLHHGFRKSGSRHPVLCAFVLSAAYAASDEYHQSFTDGRGPSVTDVMIDTAGAGIAAAIRAGIAKLRQR